MTFKKLVAMMLVCIMVAGFGASALTLDVAETADMAIVSEEANLAAEASDVWDGTVDTSWYDPSETEFTITTAEQFAGLAYLVNGAQSYNPALDNDNTADFGYYAGEPDGKKSASPTAAPTNYNSFEGKTIYLAADLDLCPVDSEGNLVKLPGKEQLSMMPVGYSGYTPFKGTFDGQGHTIKNLFQGGWDLYGLDYNNVYLGLFGCVENATIKNFVVDNFAWNCEINLGAVAGIASGNTTFENITVQNSVVSGCGGWWTGGLVGWGYGNLTFRDIIIDETTTVAQKGGHYDTAVGGILGGSNNVDGETFLFEDCYVACKLDVYNDCIANYKTNSYRNCGMIIGGIGESNELIIDGAKYPDFKSKGITLKNVEVVIGEWANYTYCWSYDLPNNCQRIEPGVGYKGVDVSMVTDPSIDTTRPFNAIFGAENAGDLSNVRGAVDEKVMEFLGITGVTVTDKAKAVYNEAKIGTDYYTTLEEAFDKAVDGDTITVIDNVVLEAQDIQSYFKPVYNRESYAGLIIPDDKTLTIDLNGKTVSYVDKYYEVDNVMILNLGNLTINDTIGGGKITYKPVAGSSTYSKFYSTIFNCGTLTVNGGTIENTAEAATDVTNAIDNHSRLSHEYGNDSILVVNGGTIIGAEYRAIRQYTHYFEGVQNRVEINGGIIKGGIYMQHGDSWYYSDPAVNRLNVNCELEINGGTITALDNGYGHIRMYLSNPDNNSFGLEINGGTIEVPVQIYVQKGYRYSEDGAATSGTLITGEASGTRNAEWLDKNGGFISGGRFSYVGSDADATSNLQSFLADGYVLVLDNAGGGTVFEEEDVVEEISVEFEDVTATTAEGEKVYNINLVAPADETINRLNSGDLSFILTQHEGVNVYEIIDIANDNITVNKVTDDRYEFHFEDKNGNNSSVENGTANSITIAQVKFTGYGKFSFAVNTDGITTNVVHATKLVDNLVDTFVPNGSANGLGDLKLDNATTGEVTIEVPTRALTINVTFPNEVKEVYGDNQQMTVTVSGGDLAEALVYELGTDVKMADGAYAVVIDKKLTKNVAYNVTVTGAGYRTARYTVTMTEDKVLNFWNNVKDNDTVVEEGKYSEKKNFLAGDIVGDNQINIYDLSAVVSYFATDATTDYDKYVKYDLNRDGVIDSKDVAYVLVSWGA